LVFTVFFFTFALVLNENTILLQLSAFLKNFKRILFVLGR
jgi:hypothetical protein